MVLLRAVQRSAFAVACAGSILDRYANLGMDNKTACAYAMVESLDENIGRLLNAIEEAGRIKNTIVASF